MCVCPRVCGWPCTLGRGGIYRKARDYKNRENRNTEPQNMKRSFPISSEPNSYCFFSEGSEAALLGAACFQAYLSPQTGVQIT